MFRCIILLIYGELVIVETIKANNTKIDEFVVIRIINQHLFGIKKQEN